MFGIIRPCRHSLAEGLRDSWTAHLCGLCLALRDDHGHAARVATNYDGLIISVLVEAQSAPEAAKSGRRKAGPCALRGMRTAEVARGEGARLAAAVSLVLAAAKMEDHVDDRDGVFARKPVAGGARKVAARWARQGDSTGHAVGFDTAVLTEAVGRQGEIEALAGPGTSVLTVTEPTETATAAAFAHTATLAGRPENAEALAEAGRLFGRLAHLLDAVEDVWDDRSTGAWNPLLATETGPDEAYRLCRDAAHGIRLALKDVAFTDSRLAHVLLVHEVDKAVDRTFQHAGFPVAQPGRRGCSSHDTTGTKKGKAGKNRKAGKKSGTDATSALAALSAPDAPPLPGPMTDGRPYAGLTRAQGPEAADPVASYPPQSPPGWQPPPSGPGNPGNPFGPGRNPNWEPLHPGGPGGPGGSGRPPGRRHNPIVGCFIWVGLCCTCQACCREHYTDPCTGQQRDGACRDGCDCDCSGCCDCCNCCECCDGCDCGCDC
ncbi:DUF5685 family protein [Yinghuangia sp. ASG 101]|uniref:DUF5685 family protein n=1 Tax=Yinghuangia sp. ASG 101 TaxID=2896848 RepID=UPI001E3F2C4A|nr:DUF5685 family protein [Yinghuangia sp. ASG 101]UGQ10318.1 DUF5685 family protein [Yinghuangia sp. ASG 101]